MRNNVITFTMSDFGRIMSNNGYGTDHAWGGHHIVMSSDEQHPGESKGGQLLGTVTNVTPGGDFDF